MSNNIGNSNLKIERKKHHNNNNNNNKSERYSKYIQYSKYYIRSNIGVQTFFFVLMSIFMIAILIYGVKNILEIEDVISEQELSLLQKDIKKAFLYCEDPLNRGGSKKIKIQHKKFNTIMLLRENPQNLDDDLKLLSEDLELKKIIDGGDNIILLNSEFKFDPNGADQNNRGIILSFNIISSFKLEINGDLNKIFTNNYGKLDYVLLDITCK